MSRDTRNIGVLALTESLWGFQAALVATGTVLTVLLKRYGAGEGFMGILSAVESGTIVLPQVLGLLIFRSRRRRKLHLILWHVFAMIPFLFIIGALILNESSFSHASMRMLLLLLFGAFNAAIGVTLAAWQDWIAGVFPRKIRGTAMGISFCFSSAAGALAALIAGGLISGWGGSRTYGALYLAAGLVANFSIMSAWFIKEEETNGDAEDNGGLDPGMIFGKFAESLKDRNFMAYMLGRLLTTAGFCVLPFVAVFYMSPAGGALSEGSIVSAGAAQTIGMAIGNFILGRIGDKYGHRIGILFGILMQSAALLLMLFSSGKLSCHASYFMIGLSISASIISHTNMVFETCPHDNRLAHITVGSLVMSAGSISLPLLAGCLASAFGLELLFCVSLFFSVLALAWIAMKLQDPRSIYVELRRNT